MYPIRIEFIVKSLTGFFTCSDFSAFNNILSKNNNNKKRLNNKNTFYIFKRKQIGN